MSVIISGDNGISDVDGSAGTPAIRGTDANTGIFFGSDIIGFSEGGAECARFNADAQFVAAAGTASLPVLTTTGDTNTGIFFPAADTIAFAEGGAEAMRIDSSGRVGIGTTSPSTNLTIGNGGGGNNLGVLLSLGARTNFYEAYDGTKTMIAGVDNTQDFIKIGSLSNHPVGFVTNNGERARITSGGALLVGATSNATPASSTSMFVLESNFRAGGTYGMGMSFNSTGATGADHYYISFNTATTTQRGYIYYNNGAGQVQLSATSDARLKENIVGAPSALPVLEQVKVRQYDWKETGNTNIGFVAQELYEVIPRAVAVGQDAEDGSIQRAWGVDNASLVPYLVKAIQELKAINDAQASRIETLEAKVAALEAK